jgi:PBP1b-binding outer membrane lipoprotein LpoB
VKSVASIALLALLLAGCAARTPYVEPPVVDMAGVDQNRYNADLSACTNEKIAATSTTLWTNDMISACMERKGYRVLAHKG